MYIKVVNKKNLGEKYILPFTAPVSKRKTSFRTCESCPFILDRSIDE